MTEILRSQGEWIFRRRGYLPILFLPLLFLAGYETWINSCFKPKNYAYEIFCYLVSFLGVLIRVFTVGFVETGTSGRGKSQKARVLNTEGLYSLTRNPLYLGNFFSMLGVVLLFEHWWLTLTFVLSFWLYYERVIIAEENYLRQNFGKEYENYVLETPPFVPDFSLWKTPKRSFSIRRVLRREYPGFLFVTLSFFVVILFEDYARYKEMRFDPLWTPVFLSSLLISLIIWVLKKFTPYLREKL